MTDISRVDSVAKAICRTAVILRRMSRMGRNGSKDGMTSNSPPAGPLPPDWFDENMHSDQFLRIIRSGLKPEPGAFELSVSAMEMAEHEWRWNSPSAVLDRRIERERKRAINDRARIGMPRSQRKADEFRVLHDNDEFD